MKVEQAITFFKSNHLKYSDLIQVNLRGCLATQEASLLSHTLTILATQGWEKSDNVGNLLPSIFQNLLRE